MVVPMMAALKHISIDPPAPEAPGPFAFADSRAWSASSARPDSATSRSRQADPHDDRGGMNLEETANLIMELGPLGRALTDKPRSFAK
jgi:hypothetical protein